MYRYCLKNISENKVYNLSMCGRYQLEIGGKDENFGYRLKVANDQIKIFKDNYMLNLTPLSKPIFND